MKYNVSIEIKNTTLREKCILFLQMRMVHYQKYRELIMTHRNHYYVSDYIVIIFVRS